MMDPTPRTGALYFGRVMHRRHGKIRHHFTYRVFSLLIDLDHLEKWNRGLRFFSHNRPNLIALYDKDIGPRDGRPLKPWIERHLIAAGLGHLVPGRVVLLCFPRLFGFSFNPLSVFFCYGADGALGAIFYEVSNTFGQRHGYLAPVSDPHKDVIDQQCPKEFYVSPFIALNGTYHFRVRPPLDRMMIAIRQQADDGQSLNAVMAGEYRALTDAGLLSTFWRYPLMSLKVIAGIHWEALRLWRKGVDFHRKPAPPTLEVSYLPIPSPYPSTRSPFLGAGS